MLVDKILVLQTLLKNHKGHRIEEQQIRSGNNRQMNVRVLRGFGSSWIDSDDQRIRIRAFSLTDALKYRRMTFVGIGSDQEKTVGIVDIRIAAGRLILSVSRNVSGHRRGHAQ